MKAGFYITDITPTIGMERPGDYYKTYVERIHDPLKVRAGVFEHAGELLALVGIDTCDIPPSGRLLRTVRNEVARRCGIPGDRVLLGASHTHSGGPLSWMTPDEFTDAPALVRTLLQDYSIIADPQFTTWVTQQIITAVVEAHRRREEALLSFGSGVEDQVLFNRRFKMANGRVYTHPGKGNPEIVAPAGPVDPEVGVVAAWSQGGELLGCIVNYGCHATTFSGSVSADYIGYLEQTVQRQFGSQAVAVFLQGASGDVTQVDNQSLRLPEFGEAWSCRVGTRVGAEVVKVLASAERGEGGPLAGASTHLAIRRRPASAERLAASRRIVEEGLHSGTHDTAWLFAKEILILDYLKQTEPVVDVEVQALQIGPAVFLANPTEYFAESGLAIKCASSFPLTYIVTLANSCFGYVPPAAAFASDGGGYETVLTSLSNLEVTAAQAIHDASLALAQGLTPGALPAAPQLSEPREPWSYGVLGPELA